MRILGPVIAIFISSIGQLYAGSIYNGTFVDAHSQVGNLISNEKVSEIIKKGDVDLTLLSFRPPKRKIGKSFQKIEKLTGKRVFRMAPIHHHFEKKGWAESTIVVRFWIISIILCMIGLATLKFR